MSRLAAEQINLRYGAVSALENVSFALEDASVHCLLGGNGAGKSSLIRIMAGAQKPTSGAISLDGQHVTFDSPRAARAAGIATVFQDLALVPLMSVWRNFVLGAEPIRGFGQLDSTSARAQTSAALDAFALQIDVERPVANLSGGQRQILAIARAVSFGARVLILDEPTAALAIDQAERVLDAIRAARSRGCAVLFVTHNPRHALAVADWVTVLRRGKVTESRAAAQFGLEEMSAAIAT